MRILLFLLICNTCFGQARPDSTGNLIILTPDYARNIEYWAQKGYSASEGIPILQMRIQSLETKVSLLETVNRNAIAHSEQYRAMVKSNAELNYKLQSDLASLREDRDHWKLKAKTRGLMLSAGGVIIGLITYIQVTK